MKAIRLTINNIGIIGNMAIDLDKPLVLFYGDLMQGKTTILNAFKWCLGGTYPADIIRHGETEASVLFEFQEESGPGSIFRSWYINREGVTTVRPVSFIRSGKPVSKPDNEIKKFLNPYLLDSDFLKKMGETERKAYFVGLFGVDTSAIDKEINASAEEAKTLRIEIKSYGEIDTTPVNPVDVTELKKERERILDEHTVAVSEVDKRSESLRSLNDLRERKTERRDTITQEIRQIEDELAEVTKRLNDKKNELSLDKININQWLNDNPAATIASRPSPPDVSVLDAQISEAAAVAVRVEQYEKNVKRALEKRLKEEKLTANEATQRDLKKKKVSLLAETSQKSGIKGLVFNEDGSFTYDGTTAAMLSTSQLMSLSQELSALYPAGFGLDLIDRAESLGFAIGKNILEFVEKAKREDKTILATIVGERPATAPPEVGVFVVENGEAK